MVVTIDIGNTDVVCVLYNEEGGKERYLRQGLKESKLKENTDLFVLELIRIWHIDNLDYIVSCVVPTILFDLKDSLKKYFKRDGKFVDYNNTLDMVEGLKYPAEIGSDLLAASYAVKNMQQPTLIVDMGSATKLILVDDNRLDSVSILLGVKNNMLALSGSITHLPNVELQFTENYLGRDTIEALQSGLMYSTLFYIQGYAEALEKQLQKPIHKVLTGGISNLFKERLPEFNFKPNLINDGLYQMYCDGKEDA